MKGSSVSSDDGNKPAQPAVPGKWLMSKPGGPWRAVSRGVAEWFLAVMREPSHPQHNTMEGWRVAKRGPFP